MASHGGEGKDEWISRVISEGPVPLLEPDNCPNGWASPPGNYFMVRGPAYLSTRCKIPAGEYLLRPLGFDWIRSSTKICGLLNQPNNRVWKVIDETFPSVNKPFVWAFNLQVPSKDNYSAVAYFTTTNPIPKGSLMERFLEGDDAFRNSRLKMIVNIVQGPWIVKRAVGEQAICIIGRALSCKYWMSENYIEVDIDIGSSMVANAIVHLAFGYIRTMTVDLAFLIEGQTESELPEQLLGAFRFSELDPASARLIEQCDTSTNVMQSSLPTRLWKSLGQGFSQILLQGAQDGNPNPGSEDVNKKIVDEDSQQAQQMKQLDDGHHSMCEDQSSGNLSSG